MTAPLQVDVFVLGEWMTNCYVVHCPAPAPGNEDCWIIDAGFEPQEMIAFIRQHHLRPQRVLLTHAHVDHIAGLAELRRVWPELPIYIHEAERPFLTDPMLNLSIVLEEPIVAPEATHTLTHHQRLMLGDVEFQVRHTPGHSPGGISLYAASANLVIVGDALFAGAVGRTDFPTSDPDVLIKSIHDQLLTLPDATRMLAGHGPATTVGRERQQNPFLH